jgi:hypothetical protein
MVERFVGGNSKIGIDYKIFVIVLKDVVLVAALLNLRK